MQNFSLFTRKIVPVYAQNAHKLYNKIQIFVLACCHGSCQHKRLLPPRPHPPRRACLPHGAASANRTRVLPSRLPSVLRVRLKISVIVSRSLIRKSQCVWENVAEDSKHIVSMRGLYAWTSGYALFAPHRRSVPPRQPASTTEAGGRSPSPPPPRT